MPSDLDGLRIDQTLKSSGSSWASKWIIIGVLLFVLLGAGAYVAARMNPTIEVRTAPATATQTTGAGSANVGETILNATGYIVAHHKIQLASKVVGKVAWIGVEKGDKVKQGQVIVRLEDDEYRAQLDQAKGQLAALEARKLELTNGSRPEEIALAKANLDQAKADLENTRITLDRTKRLVTEGVMAKQTLDDAQAKHDGAAARVASLDRSHELVRLGPRREIAQQVEGQIAEARGRLAFYETQLNNTVIRAPITGTILERVVERGEFVTTGFVGDRGAKGYVVSMADLNDLQVELDINQNDFARLGPKQSAIITTDAYPDRKYQGKIEEISPEANRQKATVQVKVKVQAPDEYLRPEMNSSVAFVSDKKESAPAGGTSSGIVYAPAATIRDNAVFVALNGKAVRRAVKTGTTNDKGTRIEEGLIGGEELILNPPADLKDGTKIQVVK